MIQIDLCVPKRAGNLPTDELSCTIGIFNVSYSFDTTRTNVPSIVINGTLIDVGYYNITVNGYFGPNANVSEASYVFSKSSTFEVLNSEIIPFLNFITKPTIFYEISENVRVDCSLDLIWFNAQGMEFKRVRLNFDLTQPPQDMTIEGFYIYSVSWTLRPLNPLILLDYKTIITPCNDPPSEICNINPFLIQVPDDYEIEVSYKIMNSLTNLNKEYKKSYQFRYIQTDYIYASIDRQSSKYPLQDLKFSGRK